MDTKTLCLAVLSEGDVSGYEIKKAFEDGPYGHIQDIGFGSIYPALGKLLADGHATVTELPQAGKPAKKIYSVTSAGRMARCSTRSNNRRCPTRCAPTSCFGSCSRAC